MDQSDSGDLERIYLLMQQVLTIPRLPRRARELITEARAIAAGALRDPPGE
jgi:hypothetical protein